MAFNTKTFLTRTASAAVFVVLLLGCVWYSYYSFVAFFTVVGFIGLYEFFKLGEKLGAKPHKILGYVFHGFVIVLSAFTYTLDQTPMFSPVRSYFVYLFLFIPFIIELFRKNPSLNNISHTFLAVVYVTLPCFVLMRMMNADPLFIFNPQKVIGMIFFIWINDTGAYLVGSFLGKHKLYERISPGKTWEGTIGGVVLCVALSYVVHLLFPQLAYVHWLAISIIVSVFGTLGDLVESMLKRMAGVKDSGSIMPGHGGVLDRFDSLFFATPFVFCYLTLMGLL